MTREQKERLAFVVMSQAADIVEYWPEVSEVAGITDLDQDEAAKQISTWMKRLPGNMWDTRLPE